MITMATQCPQFGGSPNVFVPLQQWNVGGGRGTPQQRNACGGRGGAGCGGGGCGNGNRNNQNAPPSNTQKKFLNLFYCFTCGYDDDDNERTFITSICTSDKTVTTATETDDSSSISSYESNEAEGNCYITMVWYCNNNKSY